MNVRALFLNDICLPFQWSRLCDHLFLKLRRASLKLKSFLCRILLRWLFLGNLHEHSNTFCWHQMGIQFCYLQFKQYRSLRGLENYHFVTSYRSCVLNGLLVQHLFTWLRITIRYFLFQLRLWFRCFWTCLGLFHLYSIDKYWVNWDPFQLLILHSWSGTRPYLYLFTTSLANYCRILQECQV